MSQPTPGGTGSFDFASRTLGSFQRSVEMLHKLVQQGRDLLVRLTNAVNAFFQRVQEWWDQQHWWTQVIDGLKGDIEDGLKKISAAIKTCGDALVNILTQVDKALDSSIPVYSLYTVSMSWAENVLPTVSDFSNDLRTTMTSVHGWEGDANDDYTNRVGDQQAAVSAVTGKITDVSKWLAAVGQGNAEFMLSMADSITGLLKLLTASIGDIGETAGGDVPAALQLSNHASESTGEVVAAIAKLAETLVGRLNTVVGQLNDIALSYGNMAGFPGGKWPATTGAA